MTNQITLKGYDTAGEEDLLGRKRLAKQIFELIQNTDPNWSIRVGIYGKWGSGKTTVAQYISKLATEYDFPVITISPWNCESLNKFREALHKELIKDPFISPHMPSLPRKMKKFWDNVTDYLLNNSSTKDKSRFPITPNQVSETITALGQPTKFLRKKAEEFLAFNEEDLQEIIDKLISEKKRLIIIVDDLDRVSPKLIPDLLLSLCEILDLPGFSFFLPFDREIVAQSLKEEHKAYGSGHEFLEKIIDYPFFLDEPTNNQKKDLFTKNLAVLVKHVEPSTWNELYKHLPTNPRKIKGIIRQIHMLEGELSRHEEDEINWALIFFIALIKQISPDFLGKLKKTLENDQEGYNWSWSVLSSDKKTEKRDERLEGLLKETSDIFPEQKIELKELVKACFNHIAQYTRPSLIYHFNLLDRPPSVTWKEFNELFLEWKTTNKKTTVTQKWIEDQSQKRHISIDEIADALFETIVIYRDNLLEDASNTYTLEEHCRLIEECHELLKLIEQLAKHGLSKNEKTYFQRYSYFYKYLKMVEKWIHFNTNPMDKEAREQEKKLLIAWLALPLKDLDEAYIYFSEQLQKSLGGDFNSLYQECLKISSPVIFQELLDSFKQKNKIRLMRQQENPELNTLLDHQSKFFSSPYRDAFYKLLEEGKSNTIIQSNFIDYLSLITTRQSTIQEAELFAKNEKEFIAKLWKTVISKELQFRILSEMRGNREKLLEWGMNEKDLPVPSWLSLKD